MVHEGPITLYGGRAALSCVMRLGDHGCLGSNSSFIIVKADLYRLESKP